MKYKKKSPSISLSAHIYTQLRRKKKLKIKHHQETKNGYLAPILEKDWTFLATYHGDHWEFHELDSHGLKILSMF